MISSDDNIELGDDHADAVAGLIEYAAVAVAALNRHRDLHLGRIVAYANGGTQLTEAYGGFGAKHAHQREADHGDGFAELGRSAVVLVRATSRFLRCTRSRDGALSYCRASQGDV